MSGWRGRPGMCRMRLARPLCYGRFMAGRRSGKTPPEPSLFPARTPAAQPLADRMRPRSLEEVVGQEHLLGPEKMLSRMLAAGPPPSILPWGPPRRGQTTIALLLVP